MYSPEEGGTSTGHLLPISTVFRYSTLRRELSYRNCLDQFYVHFYNVYSLGIDQQDGLGCRFGQF